MNNCVVTISIYNEEENIGEVLQHLPDFCDAIIVDDGSTDRSRDICRSLGAHVIMHPTNLGQGAGVITGFKACLMHNYDVIIEMDGDGQHNPRDIPNFLEKLKETGADIVVGSRVLGSNYENAPYFRKAMLPYYTWVINKITGYNITDSMCGFRAFRASSLQRIQHVLDEIEEPQYLAAEMFIRFANNGLQVEEIPIHLSERNTGISYKGFIRYGWGVARAIIRTWLSLNRR